MYRILSILFFSFLFVFIVQSQNIENTIISFQNIKQLNEGSLVVLLNLKSSKADEYRKIKKEKLAVKIEDRLKTKNLFLIKMFNDENFHFCPVYFVEKENYGRVYNNFDTRLFLNDKLEIDTSIKLQYDNFLFLENGSVYEMNEEGNKSAPIIQSALIFKDKELTQLSRPFPYYIDLDGVINPSVNFEKYVSNWKNNENGVKDLSSFQFYLDEKFDLTEKETFAAEKIFITNVKLFNFLEKAINDEK